MKTRILKIRKIASGISQLFTAMDKGFAKVESDLTLLTRFRHICYDANEKLERALLELDHYSSMPDLDSPDKEITDAIKLEIFNELLKIREITSDNIVMITDYIDDFSELWKRSFSLSALQKFQFLLVNEYNLLHKEIELLGMQEVHQKRLDILKARQTQKAGNEKY